MTGAGVAVTLGAMSDALTPMMQQYHRLKREVPSDAILLFRLGDFYEMFFADAEEGSRLLDLTLITRPRPTSRNCSRRGVA